jgi:hypothetical protein
MIVPVIGALLVPVAVYQTDRTLNGGRPPNETFTPGLPDRNSNNDDGRNLMIRGR